MKSFFSGGALLVSALLLSFFLISAQPSLAENLLSQFQQKSAPESEQQTPAGGTVSDGKLSGVVTNVLEKAAPVVASVPENASELAPAAEGVHYVATAYSLRGKTASGRYVSQGIIAADPRILPLGSRVRLEAGPWSGEYLVADTGGAIRGRKIDIWTPSTREAMRFGKRKVKLTVLSYPAKRPVKKRA
jgi:3D (Asp-Asp-Asp) domain-containing protein